MSFRWFIYYCALAGGCAAFVGWLLGRLPGDGNLVALAAFRGMFLGMMVALGLGLIDGLWNVPRNHYHQLAARVGVAVIVGAVGGLSGGVIGQLFYSWLRLRLFLVLGWTITGALIGTSIGAFDILSRLLQQQDIRGASRKVVNGIVGGTLGGLLGGVLFLLLRASWSSIFRNKTPGELWSPSAFGFVALGLCIGLLIGLAQVFLREAWVHVVVGFRAGREMILTKSETSIGRAESCDIGLFGDATLERVHARIFLQGDRYLVADAGTSSGTYLNGQRIGEPALLRSGDVIRVGNSSLRFGERQRHRA